MTNFAPDDNLAAWDAAYVLGALECVDLVVIFADDTPLNLVKHLKPDPSFHCDKTHCVRGWIAPSCWLFC